MESPSNSEDGFDIPVDVAAQAKVYGITLEHLQDMVQRSTRITHVGGNRRFHNFLFEVQGRRVLRFGLVEPITEKLGITTYGCTYCHDTKRVPTFDECGDCAGFGCDHCDRGLKPSFIECPMCKG